MPTPTNRAKIMMGRICALAMDSMGLVGTMFTSTCIKVGASLTFGATFPAISRPAPGWMIPATVKPRTIAIAVVIRYRTMVLALMRPNFLPSPPRLVTPTISEQNTTGTIIILMKLMKIVPMGAIHLLTKGSPSGPTPRPTATDRTSASRIWTDRFIFYLVSSGNPRFIYRLISYEAIAVWKQR